MIKQQAIGIHLANKNYLIKLINMVVTKVDQKIAGQQFTKETLDAFSFLVKEYKFRPVSCSPTVIRFESQDVIVEVSRFSAHDPSTFFVGIEITLLESTPKLREGFNLIDLMKYQNPKLDIKEIEKQVASRHFQATTPKQLRSSLKRLSKLFKRYANTALRGDSKIFTGLQIERIREEDKLAKEGYVGRIRQEAETAFRSKCYFKVIELYKKIKGDITPVEVKKFEYSKKKMKELL